MNNDEEEIILTEDDDDVSIIPDVATALACALAIIAIAAMTLVLRSLDWLGEVLL